MTAQVEAPHRPLCTMQGCLRMFLQCLADFTACCASSSFRHPTADSHLRYTSSPVLFGRAMSRSLTCSNAPSDGGHDTADTACQLSGITVKTVAAACLLARREVALSVHREREHLRSALKYEGRAVTLPNHMHHCSTCPPTQSILPRSVMRHQQVYVTPILGTGTVCRACPGRPN